MKILVTGGAGFIGSHIVDGLLEQGFEVVVVDDLSSGSLEYLHNKQVRFYEIDVSSPELAGVFEEEEIDQVIHQAAQIDVSASFKEPVLDAIDNIQGTLNLLKLCVDYGVERIVYASSAAVYGDPEYLPIDEEHPVKARSPYGISKHTPEHYLQMYGNRGQLDYMILRYANVYGPRQDPTGEGGVVSIFIDKMLNGERPVIHGDGEQTRDFIYVGDVVTANIAALEQGKNELLNLSCNTRDSINNLYNIIADILDIDLKPVSGEARPGDIRHSQLDNSRALRVLDWEPRYNLREGLKETINYYAREMGLGQAAVTDEQ